MQCKSRDSFESRIRVLGEKEKKYIYIKRSEDNATCIEAISKPYNIVGIAGRG